MEKTDIAISVNMITYNHVKYIRQAIESILNQKTNFKFELLIHDDASTDGTIDIIKEYADKYPDIVRPYYEEKNQYSQGNRRISYTFNNPRARGKYIASCEGDDFWIDENKLQYQYDFLESHPEYIAHYHAAKIVNNDGKFTGYFLGQVGITEIMTFDQSLLNFYPTASKMYRKNAFDEVPDFYFIGDAGDFPTQILLLMNGNAFYEGKTMSAYRTGVPGSSNDRFNRWSLERRLKHFDERVEILNQVDQLTNYQHTEAIEKYIAIILNNKVQMYDLLSDKVKEYRILRKTAGFKKLCFLKRVKLFLSDFAPFYSVMVESKNAIVGSIRTRKY